MARRYVAPPTSRRGLPVPDAGGSRSAVARYHRRVLLTPSCTTAMRKAARMLERAEVTRLTSVVPVPGGSVLYADREPVGPGSVTVAGATLEAARSSILAFRDDMPGANWMHPCAYALVEVSTGRLIAMTPADRPPVFGMLPASWIVVADPGGRADLVRLEPREEQKAP